MYEMFGNCSSLTSLNLSSFDTSGVTTMYYMFYNCSSLTSLDLSSFDTSKVTSFYYMFSNCSKLRTISASIRFATGSSSSSMFSNCTALAGGAGTTFDSAHTSADYARIDGGAAAPGYFTAKGSASVGGSVGSGLSWTLDNTGVLRLSGSGATGNFYEANDASKRISTPWEPYQNIITALELNGVTDIGDFAFCNLGYLTRVTIPNTVTRIGRYAFESCARLNYVFIPASVTTVATNPFARCPSLEAISLDSGSRSLKVQDGVLFNYGMTRLLSYPAGKSGSYTIPSTVTGFGNNTFDGNTKLTELIFPEGATAVAFAACYGCTALKSVTLPASIQSVGNVAFYQTALTDVYYGGDESQWSAVSIGANNEKLTSATFHYSSKPTTYTVTFNANGGSGTMAAQTFTAGEGIMLNANSFTRSGYTFNGWNTVANGSGTSYADRASVSPGANLTLYAQWTPKPIYTVTFNANGGSGTMAPQTVTAGDTITLNANSFTRSGYTFSGWNTAANGSGTSYANRASVSPNANLTLYAQWTPITPSAAITITYYANGGSGSMPAQTVTANAAAVLNTNTFTRSGYSFDGWNTKADGSGMAYPDNISVWPTSNLTLYAQWTENASSEYCKISFDFNGGEGDGTPKTLRYKGTYGTLPDAARTGYKFQFWADGQGMEVTPTTTVEIQGDHTLTAKWSAIPYQVTFKRNDGSSLNAGTGNVTYGAPYGGAIPKEPARSGYAFDGWYTLPEGGEEITAETVVTTAENHELYAHWSLGRFTVHYDAGDGQGAPADQTKSKGVALVLSSQKPSRTGYSFAGWSTVQGALTAQFKSGATYTADISITLYAVWRPLTYTVVYNANGGEDAPQDDIKTYGVDLSLSSQKPKRAGYTFNGWATSRYGAPEYQAGGQYTANAGATLYAVWARNNNSRLPGSAGDLSYRFGNTPAAFSYQGNYAVIPLAIYQLMFGDTARAEKYFLAHPLWDGNCFGMTATAGLLFENENEFLPSSFSAGKTSAGELELGDSYGDLTLQAFIEAVQISQYSELVQYDLAKNSFTDARYPDTLNALVEAVAAFERTGHDPAVVAVYGPTGKSHALLGYKVEEFEKDARLWVYDPNYPKGEERHIDLVKSNGNYTGWSYQISRAVQWGSAEGGKSKISYIPYNDIYTVWSSKGPGLGTGGAFVTVDKDVKIEYAGGGVLANVAGGQVISNRTDIFKLDYLGVVLDDDGNIISDDGGATSLWLPADRYQIRWTGAKQMNQAGPDLLGAENDDLNITLTHTDQSATVKTGASTVILDVDDGQELNYVRFVGEDAGSSYDVTLSNTLGADAKTVRLSGTVEEKGTALSQQQGSIGISGAGAEAELEINNNPVELDTGMGAGLGDVPNLVSISANGGAGKMAALAAPADAEFEFPACALTAPEGKRFSGWTVDDGERLYRPGERIELLGDAVLIAQWEDSPAAYYVNSVSRSLEGVKATVKNLSGDGGTLLAAAYDGEGRMLNCASIPLPDIAQGASAEIEALLDCEGAASVKVFIVNQNGAPLCDAKEDKAK